MSVSPSASMFDDEVVPWNFENAKLGAFGVCKAAVKVLGHRAPRGGVENG